MSKPRIVPITLFICGLIILAGCTNPSPALIETAPASTTPATTTPASVAAILVIDDFGPGLTAAVATPTEKKDDLSGKHCTLEWTGQQYSSRGASVGSTGDPHGMVVYAELSDLLKTAGGTATPAVTIVSGSSSNSPAWLRDVQLWHLKDGDVMLVGVDTGGYTTDLVKDNMLAAITFFQDNANTGPLSLPATSNFVLNMSFAVVPCEPDHLDSYVQEVNNDPALSALRDQLTAALPSIDPGVASWLVDNKLDAVYPASSDSLKDTTWVKTDPILDLLNKPPNNTKLIPVAAAGNTQGAKYPYAPALWPGVVSVSGCYKDCTKFGGDTNSGEVMDDGTYNYTNRARTKTELELGTSFAAPRVSALEAIYLLQNGVTVCPAQGTQASKPPLDYADYTQGSWQNLTVPDATTQFCPPFPTPIP